MERFFKVNIMFIVLRNFSTFKINIMFMAKVQNIIADFSLDEMRL